MTSAAFASQTCLTLRTSEGILKCLQKLLLMVAYTAGIVLAKEGGALGKMMPVFNIFAGGPLGSGRQWCSWIHRWVPIAILNSCGHFSKSHMLLNIILSLHSNASLDISGHIAVCLRQSV